MSLVSPVQNGIVGKDVILVQELHNLAERLGELGVFVASALDFLEDDQLGLGRARKGFKDTRPLL